MVVWWFLGGMVSAEMPPPSFRQGVRMVPPDSSVSVEELCWLLVSWWDMTSSALLCRWTKQWLCPIKTSHLGRRFAQLVEQVSHVQRLCPRCSRPGFDSRPGSLCCVSLPLSLTLFPVQLFSFPINKAKRPKKKRKDEPLVHQLVQNGEFVRDMFVQVSPLSAPSSWITVSSVPPFIPISAQLYSLAIEPLLCRLRDHLGGLSLTGSFETEHGFLTSVCLRRCIYLSPIRVMYRDWRTLCPYMKRHHLHGWIGQEVKLCGLDTVINSRVLPRNF